MSQAVQKCGMVAIGLSSLYVAYQIVSKKLAGSSSSSAPASSSENSKDVELRCRPLVMCGPSAVGKGTLIEMVMKEFGSAFMKKVSHTTRQPREGEVNGMHYHFTPIEQMKKEIAEGKFIEFAEVHGNMYGTSVSSVQTIAEKGAICLLEMDIQGVELVRNTPLDPYYVFVFPPEFSVLAKRLEKRGSETAETTRIRLETAKVELTKMEAADYSDLKLYNDDLDETYAKFKAALLSFYPQLKKLDNQ